MTRTHRRNARLGRTDALHRAPPRREVRAIYYRVVALQRAARGDIPVLERSLARHVAKEHGAQLAREIASLRTLVGESPRAIVRDILAYRARLGRHGHHGGSKPWKAVLAESDDD